MKRTNALIGFGVITALRLCLPISFLAAVVLNPALMFSGIRDWPSMWREMWDDPLP